MMANLNQTLSLSEKIMVKNKNPISGLMLKSDDSPRKTTVLSKPV
jgi:hypothetical protein